MCHHMRINLFIVNALDSLNLSYLLETQFKASNRPGLLFFLFCLPACLKLIDIRSSGIVVAIVMICYEIEMNKDEA
jgi:hypothetical protein